MLYLTEAEVQSLVGMDDAIEALDGAFRQWGRDGTTNLPRQRLALPERAVNLMAASMPSAGVFGHKVYFRGFFMFTLYSIEERKILAMIEAGTLGAIRTGAASGIATRHLARDDAATVGLIGLGRIGRNQLMAVTAVRPVREVAVYCRTAEMRESFAAEMSAELGVAVRAVDSAEACVRNNEIVIVATNSADPVIKGEWLSAGQHVNAVGANAYARRELDDEAVMRADVRITDDREQAKIEAREYIGLVRTGRIDWDDIGELGAVVQGEAPQRTDDGAITLFKSLGVALEDVAFAHMIYRRALAQGVGKNLEAE